MKLKICSCATLVFILGSARCLATFTYYNDTGDTHVIRITDTWYQYLYSTETTTRTLTSVWTETTTTNPPDTTFQYEVGDLGSDIDVKYKTELSIHTATADMTIPTNSYVTYIDSTEQSEVHDSNSYQESVSDEEH